MKKSCITAKAAKPWSMGKTILEVLQSILGGYGSAAPHKEEGHGLIESPKAHA